MTTRDVPRTGRLLMNLYPARYRAAHGEDIATVFTETTEGMGSRAMLRERLDLATHALRLRLRIGPTDPAGRVLAGAAPVALALGVGRCMFYLLPYLHEAANRVRHPYPGLGFVYALVSAVMLLADQLPWLLALVFAVAGRWRLARAAGAFAAFLTVALQWWEGTYAVWQIGQMAGLAVVGLLLLLAPSDLVNVTSRGRWEIAGIALGVALPMIAANRLGAVVVGGVTVATIGLLPIWLCTVAAVVLMRRLSGQRPDTLRAVGVVLATLPWLAHLAVAAVTDPDKEGLAAWFTGFCLVPLAVAAAAAGAVQLLRRPRATEPPNPA
ncbi:hypothetical protein ACFV4P_01785 [Kitasatospora sp. NPDC059795]|uniref:hypothetical protein n=1 Tax=Kitasatospora sp. NPDC059795 TaxID=3346949 RepID=UPI00364A40F5